MLFALKIPNKYEHNFQKRFGIRYAFLPTFQKHNLGHDVSTGYVRKKIKDRRNIDCIIYPIDYRWCLFVECYIDFHMLEDPRCNMPKGRSVRLSAPGEHIHV